MPGMEWLVLIAIGLPAALIALDNPGSAGNLDTGQDADDEALADRPDEQRAAHAALVLEPESMIIDAPMGDDEALPDILDQIPPGGEGQDRLSGGEGTDFLGDDTWQGDDVSMNDATAFDGDFQSDPAQFGTVIEDFNPAEDVLVIKTPEGTALDMHSQTVQDGNLIVTLSDGASFVLMGVTAPINPNAVMVVDG